MIRMMVVNDEPMIREGIIRAVDWENLDVQVVGTTGNGRDDMVKTLTEKPDIATTDIRVPIVGGTHFVKELKGKFPKVGAVFLTDYSEFKYAREAIRLGTVDYLLKPISTGDLTKLVRKLTGQVRQENATVASRTQKTVLLKGNLPMMRNRCVKHYFQGEIGETVFTEQAGTPDMDFSGQEHRIIIFCIDYYYQPIVSGEQETGLLKYAMSNIAKEVLGTCGSAVICDEGEARVMVILGTDQKTKKITRCYREAQFCIRRYYGVSISVGIEKKVEAIRDLKISYRSADEAAEERTKQGSNQVTIREGDPGNGFEHTRLFLTPEEEREVSDAVGLLDKNRVYGALKMVFQRYMMGQDLGRRGAKQLCMYLALIAMHQLERFSVSPEQALGKNYHYYNEISKYETAQDLEVWMKDIYSESLVAVDRQSNSKYEGIVAGGLAYAMEHFSENIQVGDVAQAVYVIPNCFGRVFKEKTGENFTGWLNRYRTEQARKRMDAEPETKVYAVAEETGFSGYKYFTFTSKEYTGFTPASYRNR